MTQRLSISLSIRGTACGGLHTPSLWGALTGVVARRNAVTGFNKQVCYVTDRTFCGGLSPASSLAATSAVRARRSVPQTRSTADSEYCGLGLRTRSAAGSPGNRRLPRADESSSAGSQLSPRGRAGARRGRRSGIRHAAPPCRRGVGLRVRRDPRDPARRGRCRTVVRRPAGPPAHSAVGGPAAPPVVLAHSLGDGGRLFRRAQGPFARANLRRSEESQ